MKYPNKPSSEEYPPYYKGYVGLVPEGNILELLQDQFNRFNQYLESLNEGDWAFKYAPDKWTIAQVVNHIIDTEQIFAYRALCISRKEEKELPGFDQDVYVQNSHIEKVEKAKIISLFRACRNLTLQLLTTFDDDQWSNFGTANANRISTNAIASIIYGHLEHHLQILQERYQL